MREKDLDLDYGTCSKCQNKFIPGTKCDNGLEHWISGTGQSILVHPREKCKGQDCVIHNPSDHCMRDFPTHWRWDRYLMERMCPHGVGHPDPDDIAFTGQSDVHGCDGCCTPKPKGEEQIREILAKERRGEHFGPYGTACINTGQFDAGECWKCEIKRLKAELASARGMLQWPELKEKQENPHG